MSKNAVGRSVVWGAMLVVAACSASDMNDVAPAEVATVAVTPLSSSVSIGGHLTLRAVVQNAAGDTLADPDIFWSVENAAIATVSADGVVTGAAPGTTQVSANVAGKSGLATITVASSPVASIAIAPSNPPAIGKGASVVLTATLRDASGKSIGPGRVVTWTSSPSSVASVTPVAGSYSATVKGNNEGTATITVTSEGKSASVAVSVKR